MCLTPLDLPNGARTVCRNCKQCRENRIRDWIGRGIAESEHCVKAHLVLLTYRGQGPESRMLTYPDVQLYLKRIRKAGFPLRFFCVGEYGSAKGRSHWHLLLWWQDKDPTKYIPVGKDKPVLRESWNCDQPFWDHGYSDYRPAQLGAYKYIMKYISKDLADEDSAKDVGFSKQPLLGYRYFSERAHEFVKRGLAPHNRNYAFRDYVDRDGKPIQFWMSDATLNWFCSEYLRFWAAERGGHPPSSDLIQDYCDRVAQSSNVLEMAKRRVPESPWLDPRTGEQAHFNDFVTLLDYDEKTRSWCYGPEGNRLYWSFNERGERAWQSVIRTAKWADIRKAVYEIQQASSLSYRHASRGG